MQRVPPPEALRSLQEWTKGPFLPGKGNACGVARVEKTEEQPLHGHRGPPGALPGLGLGTGWGRGEIGSGG